MPFNGVKVGQRRRSCNRCWRRGASSKLPWGEKRYFNREQFEADLKRIVAFYHDRGYPDARITSFDAKLSTDQSLGRRSPSPSPKVSRSSPSGSTLDGLRASARRPLPGPARRRLPLKAGQPLDRALIQATREAALDELKDHGYPYAPVKLAEEAGASRTSGC